MWLLAWHDLKGRLIKALVNLAGDDLKSGVPATHFVDTCWSGYEAEEQYFSLLHALVQQHLSKHSQASSATL